MNSTIIFVDMVWMAIPLAFLLFCVRITHGHTMRVVDGDTLVIRGQKCRMAGFDAPEWNQPQGPMATAEMRKILRGKWFIVLSTGRDHYKRRLVRLYALGSLMPVASTMVWRGHAFALSPLLVPNMLIARIRGAGMWSTTDLCNPRAWRMR